MVGQGWPFISIGLDWTVHRTGKVWFGWHRAGLVIGRLWAGHGVNIGLADLVKIRPWARLGIPWAAHGSGWAGHGTAMRWSYLTMVRSWAGHDQ
jgi:hypothetical protein